MPSTSAIPVAAAPTLTEVQSASRAPWLSIAFPNHSVVRLSSGHLSVVPPLKA